MKKVQLAAIAAALFLTAPVIATAQERPGTIELEPFQTVNSGSGIWDAHFLPGDSSLVLVAAGRRFSLLNFQAIEENWSFDTDHPYLYMGSRLSPDGTLAASGGMDRLVVTNVRTGAVLKEFSLADSADFLTAIDFAQDNSLMLIGGIEEGVITAFDTENFEPVRHYRCPEDCSISNIKSSDDRRLIYAASTTTIYIWDALTAELMRSFPTRYSIDAKAFRFTANAEFLIVGHSRSQVALIDTETAEVVQEFNLGTDGTVTFDLNADMTLLYTFSSNIAVGSPHQLVVWDILTGEALQTISFPNPDGEVLRSVAVSSDGGVLMRADSGKMAFYRIAR